MAEKFDINAQFDFDETISVEELLAVDEDVEEIEMTKAEFEEFIKTVPNGTSVNIIFGRRE